MNVTTWGKKALSLAASVGYIKIVSALVVLVVAGVFVSHFLKASPTESAAPAYIPEVSVASVAELSSALSPLSIVGSVSAKSQAQVVAQAGGQVTAVYHQVGDTVAAGTPVAELENASQRAAVMQAQGAYDAALASAGSSGASSSGAKSSTVVALLSAYEKVDSAVRGTTDVMFSNPTGIQPHFSVPTADSQGAIDAQNNRLLLSAILNREQTRSTTISVSDNLGAEVTVTLAELRTVRDFLDEIIRVLNAGIATNGISQTTIDTYLASATAARTSITASISALIGTQQGAETTSAGVTQAAGALGAAKANLEKTILRAPIGGTINSFSLKRGDYVGVGQTVLTVANNNALEITAYVTESDARSLKVGSSATIEGSKGTITRIAPAIDPATKKIEVKIAFVGSTQLLNGQSVTVELMRIPSIASQGGKITIPISALKIGAQEITIFTVEASSTLVAHPVVVGELLGERVEIVSGLSPDMNIVTDARGLHEGEEVVVR